MTAPRAMRSDQADDETVADDLLKGAAEIAAFLGVTTSELYYLHKCKRYPIGKLGKILIASKRQLRRAHRVMTAGAAPKENESRQAIGVIVRTERVP